MSQNPRVTLEQWQSLVAVVDAGGYAKAAQTLHKSQSSLTYAVQKMESLLGVKAFEIRGRKAHLTPTGQLLYRRARLLLDDAEGLESVAKQVSAGWEAEIAIAAEIIFPTALLLRALARFGAESPHTRIELIESVITGTDEELVSGRATLAITHQVPAGFEGEALMKVRMLPVAHPQHALHELRRPLTQRDLAAHRQIVVRESGVERPTKPIVDAAQRWTVSHLETSLLAVRQGHGYAWFPEDKVRAELDSGALKILPLRAGGERSGNLFLVYADRENAGPGTVRLGEIIVELSSAPKPRKR